MGAVNWIWRLSMPRAQTKADEAEVRIRTLVELHFDFIGRTLRRLGVTEADVDDSTQQVFVIAARKVSGIEKDREKAFLFSVALRVASDARRTRRRRREVNGTSDDHEEQWLGSCSETPESLAIERRSRAMLDEVLENMPLDLRTVFVLYEVEEMTMTEIADVLSLPAGTVASRLRRGRECFHDEARRLRARLETRGGAS